MPERIHGIRIAAQLSLAAALLHAWPAMGQPTFRDDFSAGDAHWEAYQGGGEWSVRDGAFHRTASGRADSVRLARLPPTVDAMIETRFRLGDSSRQTFGLVLRAQPNGTFLMLRYYDQFKALHVLAFDKGRAKYTGHVSDPISVGKGRWYRMKAVVSGGILLGKMWPDKSDEPDWQLRAPVSLVRAGRVGLAGHDDTDIEFSDVWIWANAPLVRMQLEMERIGRLRKIEDQLKLRVIPSEFATRVNQNDSRRISVVVTAGEERVSLNGDLTLEVDDDVYRGAMNASGSGDRVLTMLVAEPQSNARINAVLETEIGRRLTARAVLQPARLRPWRHYVERCLDTLIEHGIDRYGSAHSPMFMAVIDTLTLTSPSRPQVLDSLVRLEGRLHRRGERGSNLWYDQAALRAMYRLSELNGNRKYADAADAYIGYFFEHCRKPDDGRSVYRNGMPVWGTHIYWDCYRDRPGGDLNGDGPHEVLVYLPEWERMHRVNPLAVGKAIDGIWRWHVVDKSTGMHNRHDDARRGHDFAFSGGSFTVAFAFMYKASGEQHYLDKAKLVAGWHARHRDPITGLVADSPTSGDRYDAKHCMTTITGPFAAQLLRASEISGDPYFRQAATGYIKAFDKYAWDAGAGTYYGMLKLDGTPVPGAVELDREGNPIPGQTVKDRSNYGAWAPAGHVDIWRTSIYSYEFPLISAQAAIYAYEQSAAAGSADQQLLAIAGRWAKAIERALPARTGRRWKSELEEAMPGAIVSGGTYAENYGRALSFFVHLYRATGERAYLERAEDLAREAVTKLFENGLFRGHPAKPYYEATNGVGILLHALLEIDAPETDLGGSF